MSISDVAFIGDSKRALSCPRPGQRSPNSDHAASYSIRSPPLTQIVWPVTQVSRSASKKQTTSAMSSG